MSGFIKSDLIRDLEKALINQEFVLYYQPQFNINSANYDGVEALLRWQHPQRGLIHPSAFIRVVEQDDLIIPMGDWILKTACQQAQLWQKKGFQPVRIAVNVTERQFREGNFANKIAHLLQEWGIDPHYLELEILENFIIHKEDAKLIKTFYDLKELGVLIALDDFCSSQIKIEYLSSLPIDRIKIDKEIIKNLSSHENAARVRAIIEIAQGLNIQVLAEGVESLEQLQLLTLQHCDMVQGFYFSEPMSSDKIEKLLHP